VAPLLKAKQVQYQVTAIGAEPPPEYAFNHAEGRLRLTGFVDDIAPHMSNASIFLCPIKSGSGVRVKLLEAFARGVPVVSTYVGAEGLSNHDGLYCRLADSPFAFAEALMQTLANPAGAQAMARRARAYVEQEWDIAPVTARLYASYQEVLAAKRQSSSY